jgi:iron complex outermembrane receptor protein
MKIQRPGIQSKIAFTVALSAAIALALGGSGRTFADQATADAATPDSSSGGGLAEIVVTAQKRSESLQSVPLSVAALSSAELERRNISGLGDLMGGQVPSLRIEPFAGNPTVLEIAMRGFIDSNGVNVTNENPVPVYIDDVFYGRQTAVSLQLNEIERIEVLRGPQGTLFGKNAEGGAIRFITKEPTGEFGIREKAEGGNFGYWNTTTHLDLPSVAGVATKIDFVTSDDDGWQKNPAPGQNNFGRLKYTGARFSALWKPTEGFKAEYAFDWTQVKSTEVFNQLLATNDLYGHLPPPTFANTVWPIQTARITDIAYPTYRPFDQQKFTGHRVTLNWDLGNSLALKSISAYRKDQSLLWNTASTSAALPGVFVGAPQLGFITGPAPIYDIDHSQVSEELQLTGSTDTLKWVAGAFFLSEHGSQLEQTYFGTSFPNAILAPPAFGFLPIALGNAVALDPPYALPGQTGADISQRSYALFGQATWRPMVADAKFSYTVGLRVGRDEKDDSRPVGGVWKNVSYPATPGGPEPPPDFVCTDNPRPAGCSAKDSRTKVLPMATVAYDWTQDVNSYLRYSTGYQAAVIGLAGQTFKFIQPSTVDSLELGTKSELMDHHLRLNADVFYMNWKHPQENVQTVSSSTVEYFSGPEIRTFGVEVDAAFIPVDGLTIDISGNYLHGKQDPSINPYANPVGATGPAITLNKLTAMPRFTGSISVLYDVLRTSYGVWRVDADANTTSSYYSVPQVTVPIGGYTLINGRFSLAQIPVGAGSLDVALWGKNLTDKNYATFIYAAPAVAPLNPSLPAATTAGSFGQPRTYGVSLNFRY